MNTENILLKIVLGLVIFMFSLALAYFTASYVDENHLFDYWSALAIAAGLYVVIGVGVSQVFSISLGFLFAADVLILHVLSDKYEQIPPLSKTLLLGFIIVVLYVFAWNKLEDKPSTIS
jgi:hypothetical protein